jgi:AraC-like DNA-binding protein
MAPRLLAIYLFSLSILAIHHGLLHTNFYLSYPTLWRSPVYFSLITSPLAFLYVRSVLYQEHTLKSKQYQYFIPAFIYGLTFIPFYLLPADQKELVISRILMNKKVIVVDLDGVLPAGWGILLRIGYGLSFAIAQFFLIRKTKAIARKQGLELLNNHETYKWLNYFTIWLLFIYSLLWFVFINFLLKGWLTLDLSNYINAPQAISVAISLSILFTCFYLLFNPTILYGFRRLPTQESSSGKEELLHSATDLEHHVALKRPVEEPEHDYKPIIINYFTQNKPFLRAGYKINDLSDELGIPVYLLSASINKAFGLNFNELVNNYRVDYIADSLKSSDKEHGYTLDALAAFGGFNSRNTLINAVKKKTGETPTAYFGQFLPRN